MSRIWLASAPFVGEYEPSRAAEPIVKASAPAAARSRICLGVLTLPATISVPPSRAARAARTLVGAGR